MSELSPGSIIVKYDTEVCGEYDDLVEALDRIRHHHFVEADPDEAQYFEFFGVIGPAGGHLSYTKGKPGWHDEHGRRVINRNAVVDLGFLLAKKE
jgi:hypothetical protein